MSRVLVVYPHNPLAERDGINCRWREMLTYLRSRGHEVELLSLRRFRSVWGSAPDGGGLVDRIHLYDFRRGGCGQTAENRTGSFMNLARRWLPFLPPLERLPDYAYPGMKALLARILAERPFDVLLVSYVYWANLLDAPGAERCRTVLDVSDLAARQQADRFRGRVSHGALLAEEARRVDRFDHVLCVSSEEMRLFSGLARRPVFHFVPIFLAAAGVSDSVPQEYDLLLVASDNPQNRRGLSWFLNEVWPRLDGRCRLAVVGNVGRRRRLPRGVVALPGVADLASVYARCRVAICPVLGGTGMKVKVVEAMRHGVPVVATPSGLSGFPDETPHGCLVAETATEFAACVRRLLEDPSEHERRRRTAADCFARHFSRTAVYPSLDAAFGPRG